MLMPAGAKLGSACISMRLKEPFRRLPQMATMFMELAPFLFRQSSGHRRHMYELAARPRNRLGGYPGLSRGAIPPPAGGAAPGRVKRQAAQALGTGVVAVAGSWGWRCLPACAGHPIYARQAARSEACSRPAQTKTRLCNDPLAVR